MAIVFNAASFASQEFGLSGSARTLAFGAAVSSGSLLVVAVSTFNSNITVTVSDDVNGSYTQVGTYVADGGNTSRLSVWYFENSGAGTPTVTVTPSGSAYISMALHEYTGALTASSLRANSGGNTGTGTSVTTLNAGASATDLVFAAYSQGSATVTSDTVASPFTIRCNTIHGSTGEGLGTADDVAAAGDEGATFTVSPSVTWQAIAAAFKAAAPAGVNGASWYHRLLS